MSLYCAGIALFTDKYPHQIADANGVQIGNLDAVLAYFDSLGIGQEQGGGTGGYYEFDSETDALSIYSTTTGKQASLSIKNIG